MNRILKLAFIQRNHTDGQQVHERIHVVFQLVRHAAHHRIEAKA